MSPPPVHFRGIVLGPSGFAAEGREWLWALERAGLEPSLEGARLGDVDCALAAAEGELLRRCAARPRRPGALVFHHLLVPHFVPDPGAAANVLCTVFETEGLPPGWAERAGGADRVLVHTDWARETFARAGVTADKLAVLPPPLDPAPFPARDAARRRPGPMRWLSVLEWSLRKGWDVLLRAFAASFRSGEAELWLKVSPGKPGAAAIQARCAQVLAGFADPPRVLVRDDAVASGAMARLYHDADAFVLASRGEGWGRPVHEAMLCEVPVVASGATALRTLLPDARVGYPVATRPVPVPPPAAAETPWFAEQTWHEPDPDDLGRRLREVAADPAEAGRRARRAREHVLSLCDRATVAEALREILVPMAR